MLLTKNLIGQIIDRIRECFVIDSIDVNGDVYTINTTDTKSLIVGDFVTISDVKYQIIALVADTSFNVESSTAVVGDSWTACAPYYFSGVPMAVSNELKRIHQQQKYPFIYLWETIEVEVSHATDTLVARDAKVRLFFMDQADSENWLTEDHFSEVIVPTVQVVRDFVNAVEDNEFIAEENITTHTEKNHADWGLIRKPERGPEENVFDEKLSGIELNINLPMTCDVYDCAELSLAAQNC